MKYRIYYSDGTTKEDSEDYSVRDVQAILQKNDEGQWIVRTGSDYYIYRDGEWTDVDFFGLIDYLLDTKQVLFGRTIINTKYSDVMRKALADREKLNG